MLLGIFDWVEETKLVLKSETTPTWVDTVALIRESLMTVEMKALVNPICWLTTLLRAPSRAAGR